MVWNVVIILVNIYVDDTIVDQMCHYCEKWRLSIKSSKTEVIFGRYETDVSQYQFLCDGEKLYKVSNIWVLYLIITVHLKLPWRNFVNRLQGLLYVHSIMWVYKI